MNIAENMHIINYVTEIVLEMLHHPENRNDVDLSKVRTAVWSVRSSVIVLDNHLVFFT